MMRFDSFEFDAASRRLVQDGQAVHLTPKAFDLLRLLIGASPKVLSKAELHAQLWPNQAISDATLVGLVKELRRALDDHDSKQRIIRTVHRVGYAFDAELDSGAGATAGLLVIGRRRARLVQGGNLIGRDPACDVWIEDATVSRRHARIVIETNRVALEDLGSKNGTSIGDRAISSPQRLQDGDRIRFGSVDAIFRDSPSQLATITQLSMAEGP